MLPMQDTMRETCLTDLAGIWYNLVATYSESNPDLAEAVLAAVRRYVSWIDIGLVANDRCSACQADAGSLNPGLLQSLMLLSLPCALSWRISTLKAVRLVRSRATGLTACQRRFVPMLVALLGAASGGLAGAAADVLSEIVLKRMDSTAKLRCKAPADTQFHLEFLTRPLLLTVHG